MDAEIKPKKKKLKFSTRVKKRIMGWICAVDEVLDKASRPLIYFLELVGVIIVIYLMLQYISAIWLIKAGKVELGTKIIAALSLALGSMKEVLVGIFVVLPASIGTLKAFTKKWKGPEQPASASTPISEIDENIGMTDETK